MLKNQFTEEFKKFLENILNQATQNNNVFLGKAEKISQLLSKTISSARDSSTQTTLKVIEKGTTVLKNSYEDADKVWRENLNWHEKYANENFSFSHMFDIDKEKLKKVTESQNLFAESLKEVASHSKLPITTLMDFMLEANKILMEEPVQQTATA